MISVKDERKDRADGARRVAISWLWDTTTGAETARLEANAIILCSTSPGIHIVAGDTLGRLHWPEVRG
jgi:hypothetical protein